MKRKLTSLLLVLVMALALLPGTAVRASAAEPVITGQPADVAAAAGERAIFTVETDGEGLTYKWQYRTSADGAWSASGAEGAKTASLSILAAVSRDGYQYRCVITDADGGKVISQAATLTVLAAVTAQPKDVSAKVGDTAQFTVKAAGVELTYKWQYRTSADGTWSASGAEGAKTASLSIPVAASRDGYQYRCVITDAHGTKVISQAATLTVLSNITTQPKDKNLAVGKTAKFTVKATGVGLTYKWQYRTSSDGTWSASGAEGAKTAALSIPVTAKRNGYQYRCVITDAHGDKVYSEAATLTVKTTVTAQPKDVYLPVGETAKFTVKATGAGLTYQWQYRSANGDWKTATQTGNKTASLSVPVASYWAGYQYRCRITDANGKKVYSDAATLKVKMTIITQPESVTLPRDETAQFTVEATGAHLKYQWQYRSSSTGTWADSALSGCKSATLSVPVTKARNGYQYRCVITDDYGNVARTSAATLTVDPYRAHGTCGDKLTWTLSYEGVLTVSGTGAMWDDNNANPWKPVQDKIRSVVIEDGVTTIKPYAFFDTAVTSLTLGKDLKTIGTSAFRDAMDLRAVTLPDGLETIGTFAFQNTNLKSVTIPDSVTTIGSSAFGGCWQLTSVQLPSGLKRIESRILSGCSSLKSITIPETVESIGEAAFGDCKAITSIVIPKSVKSISYSAMAGCNKLSTVKFMGAAPDMPANIFYYNNLDKDSHDIKVYYPSAYASSWDKVEKKYFGNRVEWYAY